MTRTASVRGLSCRASYDSADDDNARYSHTYRLSVMRSLNRPLYRLATCLAALMLASCLATQSTGGVSGTAASALPGFWMGFWHGIIAPVAFLISLFSDATRIYAWPNSGHWYDFGFVVGIGGFGGLVAGGYRRTGRAT